MTGVEWVIDARGCDAARLTDKSILAELFDGIIRDLSLNVVGAPMWHVFPGAGGITGLCLLSESHLAVHTFPEHGSLCLNLFCCTPRAAWPFAERLRELLGADRVTVRHIERAYGNVAAATAASD